MNENNRAPRDDPEESERFIKTAKRIGIAENNVAFIAALSIVRSATKKTAPAKKTGAKVKSAKRKR